MLDENYENQEASFESFSGTDSTFNQKLPRSRGSYRAKDKTSRATIQIEIENKSAKEQVYELFNSNNSISIQPDDSLYVGRTESGQAYQPIDVASIVNEPDADGSAIPEPVASFTRKGNLVYIDNIYPNGALVTKQSLQYALLKEQAVFGGVDPTKVKISIKSTLQGNTYRRFIEKMKTSVIHVIDWKIQCLNEAQFQLPIGQKDFSILGASTDDEFQVSSSISSKDFNTKIVEINDKQLLIDGDTRITGIILPNTKMVFTFSIDIINENTFRSFINNIY